MHTYGKITSLRYCDDGTADLLVHTDADTAAAVMKKQIHDVWMQMDDGRQITVMQRKKIFATLNDISAFTGYMPQETEERMKFYHIQKTGCEYFSLSDCSMDTAREFLDTLIDFCLYNGVAMSENMLERTDDIGKYLVMCMRYRKCAVCGKAGEVHHWDAIGMGNDRTVYDDTNNRKICLCRTHHTIAHQKGRSAFERDYHVYGIIFNED